MPRLPGSMLVTATPTWSLIRVMWYSNGPGMASNCQSNSAPQNWPALAVSSAGISKCAGWPGIATPLASILRRGLGSAAVVNMDLSVGGNSSVPARATGDAELRLDCRGPQSESPPCVVPQLRERDGRRPAVPPNRRRPVVTAGAMLDHCDTDPARTGRRSGPRDAVRPLNRPQLGRIRVRGQRRRQLREVLVQSARRHD